MTASARYSFRTFVNHPKTFVRTAALLAVLAATAARPAEAQNFNTPSGLMLGIYADHTWQGLRVRSTIRGFPAEGRLMRNDVLLRVSDGFNRYPVRTLRQLEFAKSRIGAGQPAALELYRPGWGTIYLWVEFDHLYTHGAAPAAKLWTERERPGAKNFFHGQGNHTQPGPGGPFGGAPHQPDPGTGNPQDLFRN